MDVSPQVARLIATTDYFADEEPAAQIWERRWFAASAAVKSVQAECEVLLAVIQLAVDEWRRSCAQLAQLEALRDALGERLAAMNESRVAICFANSTRSDVGGGKLGTLDGYAGGSHTRASNEVHLSLVLPSRAAAGASLSHEQIFPAQGPPAR
jgi:hypothetical protein